MLQPNLTIDNSMVNRVKRGNNIAIQPSYDSISKSLANWKQIEIKSMIEYNHQVWVQINGQPNNPRGCFIPKRRSCRLTSKRRYLVTWHITSKTCFKRYLRDALNIWSHLCRRYIVKTLWCQPIQHQDVTS